jgi:hypothetical protein
VMTAGIDAEPLEGAPAVITTRIGNDDAPRIVDIVAANHVVPASIIPLWEDIVVPAVLVPPTVTAPVAFRATV